MKIFVLILFWSLLLYSCKEISFKEPQPAGVEALKELPKALHGRYVGTNEKGKDTDTLIVESWGYHFRDTADKDLLGRGVLSDTLVVKYYSNYYFVNFRVVNQWVLRLVKQKPSGDLDFLSIKIGDDNKRKKVLKKLSKKLKVTEVDLNGDKFYQISPTKEQLMQLVKEGYFTGDALSKVK